MSCDVKVNGSCGLHVHIDAAGFSMETWRNLALSYKHLEPVIDRFMPASAGTTTIAVGWAMSLTG